jgi:hypothetical protein
MSGASRGLPAGESTDEHDLSGVNDGYGLKDYSIRALLGRQLAYVEEDKPVFVRARLHLNHYDTESKPPWSTYAHDVAMNHDV